MSPATTSAGPSIVDGPAGVGQLDLQPGAAGQPVGLAGRAAVQRDPAFLGQAGDDRAGQPEQPGQPGVDAHPVQTVGDRHLAQLTHRPAPPWIAVRVPSISTPRSVIRTSRIPPQTIPESATLNTGQTLPSGANSETKSTTCPRSGPG